MGSFDDAGASSVLHEELLRNFHEAVRVRQSALWRGVMARSRVRARIRCRHLVRAG
jgi:hypothetical protein